MNKKFSTLVVSLFLAGGMFSTANASEWPTDDDFVLNTGKYHLIHQVAGYSGSWSQYSGGNLGWYLALDASGDPVFTRTKNEKAYWTITTKDVAGVTYYQLTNVEGETFAYTHNAGSPTEKKIDWFIVESDNSPVDLNDFSFMDGVSQLYLNAGSVNSNGDVTVVANVLTSGTRGFDNVEIAEEVITAANLNAELNGAFQLNFKDYESLEGNVFAGKLTALPISPVNGDQYYFQTEDGKYIVLTDEVWSKNTANLDGRDRSAYSGYKFDIISKHAFDQLTSKDNAIFSVYKSYDFNNTDSLIVTMPKAKVGTMSSVLNIGSDCPGVRVFVPTVNDINYVTVIEYDKANDMLAKVQDNAYPQDASNVAYEVGALAPYIELGESNIVDYKQFAGKVWNITDANGNALTPMYDVADIDSYEEMFMPKGQIDLVNPEGHWLPLFKNNQFNFVNRESGNEWDIMNSRWVLRSTATPGKYEIYSSKYAWAAKKYTVYITEAKDAELGRTEKGYAQYAEAEELLNGKVLSFENSLGVTAYVGKDADDNVILTTNEDEAIEFRVKQLTHDFADHDGAAGIDTLMHFTPYSYLKDGEWKNDKQDTLQFYHYTLYDHFSEKYLKYNKVTKKYELSERSKTDNAHENFDLDDQFYSFVVKSKADGSKILVRNYAIDYDYCTVDRWGHHTIASDWNGDKYKFDDNYFQVKLAYDANTQKAQSHKVYAATQPGTLAEMTGIYNYNDNDRVSIENIATPEYMTITMSQDTIKIGRFDKANYFMFEQHKNGTNFLAMEHVSDVDDMKAAILADTAYVRDDTYKPQYLLGVGTDIKVEEFCSRPDLHDALHKDTVYGRFLINMVDSAYAYGINKKSNPYIWDTNNFFRLGFVEGFHTEDYLFFTENGKKTGEKIFLGNNEDKVCTFAFRYVDEEREGVKIETLYNTTTNGNVRGWVKYHNGIPVVINDYEEADVFTVDNETEEAPTANEGINASEVSVVATNGAVIVKGAEGKNVVITNVLGQQIANTVVSSSEATIAAPAGVVVVAVEGEAAVKAIVK